MRNKKMESMRVSKLRNLYTDIYKINGYYNFFYGDKTRNYYVTTEKSYDAFASGKASFHHIKQNLYFLKW